MLAVELYVVVRPKNLPAKIQCHDASIAEHGKNALAVGDGRRCGVRVLALFAKWRLLEDFLIPENRARFAIKADHVAFCACFARAGQKDVVLPNDRGRPTLAWNRCFPFSAFIGAPFEWQITLGRNSLAGWPPERRPVFGNSLCGNDSKQQQRINRGHGYFVPRNDNEVNPRAWHASAARLKI